MAFSYFAAMNWFTSNRNHIIIVGIFIILSFSYFSPVLKGEVLYQGDVLEAKSRTKEIMDFKTKTGKSPLWTNAMYGGMPTYQIWVEYPNNIASYVISTFKNLFPNPVDTLFLYLLGGYFLFIVLGLNPWLAAVGAISFAFSSYNIIYIAAGHANQAMAIGYFAPILAGIILTFRGNYLLGGILTALFLAIEIRTNHLQMTYYLFIAILLLCSIELFISLKRNRLPFFLRSISCLSLAALLAVSINASMLWTTYEYAQESIRGKSNLVSNNNTVTNGLNRDYAYNWSQGVSECITFLIPNAYGGSTSSQILGEGSMVSATLIERGLPPVQAVEVAKQMPTYWGEKLSGTAGPWYFGSIICFLFIFGLFVVKDSLKWWIAVTCSIFLLLSFGKNFPLVSDLFFNYFPLYNKFRAVESTLVIPSLLFPLLAMLAVKEIVNGKHQPDLRKKLLSSLYITGGILLCIYVFPTLFLDFKASNHQQFVAELTEQTGGDRYFANEIAESLVTDRVSIARADTIRSLIFVLLSFGLIWFSIKGKVKNQTFFIGMLVLILIDLWTIDRRYLNEDNFHEPEQLTQSFKPREVDLQILEDKTLNYRVLDLSLPNPFSNATPSYFHKTVGGSHTARLKRFDELVERQFSDSINHSVLDMLNTRYLINSDGESINLEQRNTACGNAWFVEKVTFVKDAEEEVTSLTNFDPRTEAFIQQDFKPLIDAKSTGSHDGSMIQLISYSPDHLVYQYTATKDAVAVFADIWYDKGWNAYVDGKLIPHFRANYVLRAAQLPGGKHKFEFVFEPESYKIGEMISLIGSVLVVSGLIYLLYRRGKSRTSNVSSN